MDCFPASLLFVSLLISTAFGSRGTDLNKNIDRVLQLFKTFELRCSVSHHPKMTKAKSEQKKTESREAAVGTEMCSAFHQLLSLKGNRLRCQQCVLGKTHPHISMYNFLPRLFLFGYKFSHTKFWRIFSFPYFFKNC